MRPSRPLALILLLLLFPAAAAADHTPPDNPPPGPCMGDQGYHGTWLDRTHAFFTQTFCQPAVWFDNFFGDERAFEEGWPGTTAQLKLTYRLDDLADDTFDAHLFASVRLPNASDRLKLILTSDLENEQDQLAEPGKDIDSEVVESDLGDDASAGLRYHVVKNRRNKVTLGGGLRLANPPDPYVRLRLRHTEPLGDRAQLRFVPTILASQDRDVKRSLRMDVETLLGKASLGRLSLFLARNDNERETLGNRWSTELTYLFRINRKRALSVDLGQQGVTRPSTFTTLYRLSTTLRVNFHRPWLYYEVEPELFWPRDDAGDYDRGHALNLRLEINFIS